MKSMEGASDLEAFLKRDRWFVAIGLAGATAIAWIYLIVAATKMDGMTVESLVMPVVTTWSSLDFWLKFVMWAVMMVGMMLPSAAPMILLYAAVSRRQHARGHVFAPTGVLVVGYLVVWTVFSIAATVLQWALEQATRWKQSAANSSLAKFPDNPRFTGKFHKITGNARREASNYRVLSVGYGQVP